MYWFLILVFVLGYLFIALEHSIHVDKAASAILTGVLCWTILVFGSGSLLGAHPELAGHLEETTHFIDEALLEHVGEIAEILFFLLAAMTIVEMIDAHKGFQVVTDKITTTSRIKLLWIICTLTFFFSAVLDNLTTAIVMAALLKKLIHKKEDLWFFGGMVVIAANAGGAWSPIGDVTTIMLWIGGQITAMNIIITLFIPSVLCLLLPLLVVTARVKGNIERPKLSKHSSGHVEQDVSNFEQKFVFWFGVGGLLFVPVFKSVTHLPPFMGMLLSLGALWVLTELIHRHKANESKKGLSVSGVIRRIDTPSILFFLGILLAVASLQTAGHLRDLATILSNQFSSIYIINTFIGLLSAVVDNVPLVAGAMGMYSLETYAPDNTFWELLAYCAGTGGSALIIGSAAGVAIMGLLRIDFMWYLKNISWLALIGYFSGIAFLYLARG
ncbi:MAG: sodium:proton antiporter NhaD [Chitinophagales bacterium]